MRFGVIYKVTNRVNGKVYIGQTIFSASVRWKQHVHKAKTDGTFLIHNAIRKYGVESFSVEEIASAANLSDLNATELRCVLDYRSLVPTGYNLRLGGKDGAHLPETIEKIRTSSSNRSEATRKLYSQRTTERWESPEYRARLSKSHKASWTIERRQAVAEHLKFHSTKNQNWKKATTSRKIPIIATNLTTGETSSHASGADCSRLLNFHPTGINGVLKGRRKTYKGFSFSYLDKKSA